MKGIYTREEGNERKNDQGAPLRSSTDKEPQKENIRRKVHFLLRSTSTATTIATIMRMTTMIPKQIQRFLRAARADTTAFSVC